MNDLPQKWFNTLSLVIIAGLLLVILLQRSCGTGGGISIGGSGLVKTDTVIVVDTIVQTHHDTLWQKEIVYMPPAPPPAPKIVYVNQNQDTVRRYVGERRDSTISIGYVAVVTGVMDSIGINYKLVKPITITKYIDKEITKTVTVTNEIYRNGFYFGGGVGYSNHLQQGAVYLGVDYSTRKGWQYGYSYDLLNKQHRVGVKYRLFTHK